MIRRPPRSTLFPYSSLLLLSEGSSTSLGSFVESRMGSFTTSPQSTALPVHPGASVTIRIEPPRSLFELRLREVWAYRELLYFSVWRDVKVRYKQTIVGVAWVVLQQIGRAHV